MKKLSELGVDHEYAPDAEPAFFQTVFEQISQFVIDYNEVVWFIVFLMAVLVLLTILRSIWSMLGRLLRRPQVDIDLKAERRRRLRMMAKARGIETDPVIGGNR